STRRRRCEVRVMVEETPQINPVDPDPGPNASSNGKSAKGSGSPWQTNGVVSEPTFVPSATDATESTVGEEPASDEAEATATTAPAASGQHSGQARAGD